MTKKLLCLGLLNFSLALPLLRGQTTAAPSPDKPGAEGSDLGAYNWTNSVEFGYRFNQIGGDSGLFRATENYGNGIRLFQSSTTAHSKTGHGFLFDSLSLTTQGLGNDPYATANLRIEKNERYTYNMTWRQSDYFNP